jgi:hypothetical protein
LLQLRHSAAGDGDANAAGAQKVEFLQWLIFLGKPCARFEIAKRAGAE